jgi:uncharacterized BrkB/YihY/UPF0761 family membrane protein
MGITPLPQAGNGADGTPRAQTINQPNLIVLLISVALAIFGLLTAGLPGGVVLQAAESLAGIASSAQLSSDQAWPAALAISFLGPFALIPAHLILRRAYLPSWQHAVIASAVALAVILACSVAGILLIGQ